jgi:hypothetical protein
MRTNFSPYVRLYSRRKFWPANPEPGSVCIEDIALGLAKNCRYNGLIDGHYSVAEHSILVSQLILHRYGGWAPIKSHRYRWPVIPYYDRSGMLYSHHEVNFTDQSGREWGAISVYRLALIALIFGYSQANQGAIARLQGPRKAIRERNRDSTTRRVRSPVYQGDSERG